MVIYIQATVCTLMAILILLCQRKRLRNFKGNLRPPELLGWINAIGLRPSSCVVQRATSIIFFFYTFNFFLRTTWSFIIFGLKHCYDAFWKIADFEKYIFKVRLFWDHFIGFEKKYFNWLQLHDFAYMIRKKDTLVMLIKNKIIF